MVLTRATNQPGPGRHPRHGRRHPRAHQHRPRRSSTRTRPTPRHPSHQVFLRAYELNAAGDPVATGKLITNRDLGADGEFGTADDVELGGMSTWARGEGAGARPARHRADRPRRRQRAADHVDAYGNFIPAPTALPSCDRLGADGLLGTDDDVTVEGNPAAPVSPTAVTRCAPATCSWPTSRIRANPFNSQTGAPLAADADRSPAFDDNPRWHLRRRAAGRALHGRRRARQREHRPHRRPPRLPRRAQPPGRPHQGCDPSDGVDRRRVRS